MKDEVIGSLVFAYCVIVLSDIFMQVFSEDIWFLCCCWIFCVLMYAIDLTSCSSISGMLGI
jgi:hypothetical protein